MVEHIRVIIAISALILGACGGTDPISDVLEDTTLPDVGIDEGQTNPDPGSPSDPGNPTPDPGQPSDPGPIDEGPEPQPVLPEVCSGNTEGSLQMFGGACCYTPTYHDQNPECVWYDSIYQQTEGQCLDAQCTTNRCTSATYCTQTCNINKDSLNNATAEPGADGINDPDGVNTCQGAVDGPLGKDFQCVNLRSIIETPFGICRPGTDFAQCDSNDDCPVNQGCELLYVHGHIEARCMTAEKNGSLMSEACNRDPNSGPIQHCASGECYGAGCVTMCKDPSECATDNCVDGFCSKDSEQSCTTDDDCSAWECTELTPYTDDTFTHDFCQAKNCTNANDCADPDWFCRPYWNGADTIEDVALEPACRKKVPETVGYGEACGFEDDGTGLPSCAWSSGCIDNYCGGPCVTNNDCGDGTECLRAYEWNVDVDDDDEGDTYVNVDICQPWPYSNEEIPECTTNADCEEGSHCQYRVVGSGEGQDRVWSVEYKCRANYEGQVSFGELCGGDTGQTCDSDLCLVPSGSETAQAMCTEYCTQASDCPSTVTYEGLTYKNVCLSFNVGNQNNADLADDLYVPYCWRTSSFSSIEPCDENRQCDDATEYCRAHAIAGNPDEPATVEYLCLDAKQTLSEQPTKRVGEPCSSWTECLGRSCQPDGEGDAYCSELCASDEDCQNTNGIEGLKCTTETLIPRLDPANSAVTQRCVLQKTCLSCASNDECGGDYICVNSGGYLDDADYRCSAPCDSSEDCLEEGTTCKEEVSPTGVPSGIKTCLPTNCE